MGVRRGSRGPSPLRKGQGGLGWGQPPPAETSMGRPAKFFALLSVGRALSSFLGAGLQQTLEMFSRHSASSLPLCLPSHTETQMNTGSLSWGKTFLILCLAYKGRQIPPIQAVSGLPAFRGGRRCPSLSQHSLPQQQHLQKWSLFHPQPGQNQT